MRIKSEAGIVLEKNKPTYRNRVFNTVSYRRVGKVNNGLPETYPLRWSAGQMSGSVSLTWDEYTQMGKPGIIAVYEDGRKKTVRPIKEGEYKRYP